MMGLKSIHELIQDLLLSFFASPNIWVIRGIVVLSKLLHRDGTIPIQIEDVEGSLTKISSKLVHLTNNTSDEFIE